MKTNQIQKIFFIFALFSILWTSRGQTATNALGIDTNMSYDIYFYTGENARSLIKNVRILRFQDISGRTFVVITSAEFKLKDSQGFVALDNVSAILPNQELRAIDDTRFKINY